MALIAQTFTEFFVQLDAQSDLTMVDVLDTLSKIENISAKLTNIVSASSWYGHEQMSAMLKECADKPWWTSFLNASWLQFIESLRLHPSETEFETHCREGFQNVMAVESLFTHRSYYVSAIFVELKYLFYTECLHMIRTSQSNPSTPYDVTHTTYKWPGQPPNTNITLDTMHTVNIDSYNVTIDEVIDLSSYQQTLLTFGFIHEINSHMHQQIIPSVVNYLCLEYAKFVHWNTVPNENDSVNFVTLQDIKYCEMYRQKGNEYFKSKQYEDASVKYNKALFFDADNALVYNNLSLCYLKLGRFDLSKENAFKAVHNDPSVAKAWIRLAMACQQLQQYEIATLCILIAYCITLKHDPKRCVYQKMSKCKLKRSNVLHRLYLKNEAFIKENVSCEEQEEIEHNVALFFESERYHDEMGWWGAIAGDILDNDKEMKQWYDEHKDSADFGNVYFDKLQTHAVYIEDKMMFDLYQLYLESKWNMKDKILGLKHILYCWNVSYMSLKEIQRNKRCFGLNMMQTSQMYGDMEQKQENICGKTVCGKPNGKRLIKELLRIMANKEYKPRLMFIAWRIRNEFEEIKEYFEPMGIQLILESEADAKKNAHEFGNDHDGWNHMIWD